MNLRHRTAEWAGMPTHLVYGPVGALEFRPVSDRLDFPSIVVHRARCWDGCEEAPDADGPCRGGRCDWLEMGCHFGIYNWGPDVEHLAGCVGEAEIVSAMTALYPRMLGGGVVDSDPPTSASGASDPGFADRLRNTPFGN